MTAMPGRPIVFFTALPMEAAAIEKAFERSGIGGIDVVPIGIRGHQLPDISPPASGTLVVVAGLAGGLDPSLSVGDVVLDAPDNLQLDGQCVRARIHTAVNLVTTPMAKASLFTFYGAAAVDMEQSIVTAWANFHGVTVIGLRALSDSASDALDPKLLTLVDSRGRPRLMAIVRAILVRPFRIVSLITLGLRSRRALRNLATAAVALVRSSTAQ